MKTNKFKIFACIGLGILALIVVSKIPALNNLKKVNKLDKVSTISGTNFNFSRVDENSSRARLAVISKTSTNISVIPEKRKVVKFEVDGFLTPEVEKQVSDSSGFNHWLSTHTYFDYFLYTSCALMVIFWFNFPNLFYCLKHFPMVFFHCRHCGVVRPFALHQESCRRRERNFREKIIDKLEPSWNSNGYPITRTIINALWDISTFPLEVIFSLVMGVLWTAFYIPASSFVLIKEGGGEASEFIKELGKYLWLILTNPWRRMGRLLTTGTTDN